MATNKRTYPNDYFSWYNDDARLAIVCRTLSSDSTTTVSNKSTDGNFQSFLIIDFFLFLSISTSFSTTVFSIDKSF